MEIIFYNKKEFFKWLDKLDSKTESIIFKSLERIKKVNIKNYKNIRDIKDSNGIFELKISYGSGYRVYFAKRNGTFIIILCAGDKGSQTRDIIKAKKYFEDYKKY